MGLASIALFIRDIHKPAAPNDPFHSPAISLGSGLWDIFFGTWLLFGSARARNITHIRLAITALSILLYVATQKWAEAGFTAFYVVLVYWMLREAPGVVRKVSTVVMAVGFSVLLAIGLVMPGVASAPQTIQGERGHYRLVMPAGWNLCTPDETRTLNREADRVVTERARDLIVTIIAEQLAPDRVASADFLLNEAVRGARTRLNNVRELHRGVLEGHPGVPLVELGFVTRDATAAQGRMMIALFKVREQIIQVIGAFPEAATPEERESVLTTIRSVQVEASQGLVAYDGGVGGAVITPLADGGFVGQTARYTLRAPADWYAYTPPQTEQVPGADRMMMVPYEGTSMIVIAEPVERGDAPLEQAALVRFVRESLAQDDRNIRWRADETLTAGGHAGTLVQGDGMVTGHRVVRKVWAYAGTRATYRFLLISEPENAVRREADFRAMLGTLTLPE